MGRSRRWVHADNEVPDASIAQWVYDPKHVASSMVSVFLSTKEVEALDMRRPPGTARFAP